MNLSWIHRSILLVCLLSGMPGTEVQMPRALGDVRAVSSQGNDHILHCMGGRLRIQACTPSIIRISVAPNDEDFPIDETQMVVRYDWPLVDIKKEEDDRRFRVTTSALSLEVAKSPLQLTLFDAEKSRLLTRTTASGGFDISSKTQHVRLELDAGGKAEHLFGLGMQFWSCDLRGLDRQVAMSAYYAGREEGKGETHYPNPFFISTAGYGVYLHTAAQSRFDLGSPTSPGAISISPSLGNLDLYLFAGSGISPIIQSFNQLCGMPTMPPRYALGLIYRGCEKNGSGEKLMSAVRAYRNAGIPLDMVGTEPTWQTYRFSHKWSPSFVKDPSGWLGELRDLGIRVNLWERCEFWMDKSKPDRETDPAYDGVAKFAAGNTKLSVPDLTLREARAAWFSGARSIGFDRGVHGFKVDENERRWISDKSKDEIVMPSGIPADMYANLHPMLVGKTYTEGCREAYNRRYFGLSRAGFTGSQRYPAVGYTDASDFCEYIRATVNMSFWGPYFCPEYRQTVDRHQERLQMMFLAPYAQDDEWVTGAVVAVDKNGRPDPLYLRYARLRYRIMPYLYSAFWNQHRTGLPVIRHTLTEFPKDQRAWRQDLQYFLGHDLLIAPLYENPRRIYLPEGTWIDFWSGRRVVGERSIEWRSNDGNIPIFIRSGAIIPQQPPMDWVGQKPIDPLTILVTPGTGASVLYEDDGETYNFERGDFAETPLEVAMSDAAHLRITIGTRHAPGQFHPTSRTLVIEALAPGGVAEVTINGRSIARLEPSAQSTDTSEGFWSTEDRSGTIFIRTPFPSEKTVVNVQLERSLDDGILYQSTYAAERADAARQIASQKDAAAIAIISTALTEADRMSSPARALARLNACWDAIHDLTSTVRNVQRTSSKGITIANAPVKGEAGDPAKDLLVRHDTALPAKEAKALLSFSLDGLPRPPKSVHLTLHCLDASDPIKGHNEIHLMLYAMKENPDLGKLTWSTARLDTSSLIPVVDFFPATNQTAKLDVTAAIRQAYADGRDTITFVLDSLDDMGSSRPIVIAGPRNFEKKSIIPTLHVAP